MTPKVNSPTPIVFLIGFCDSKRPVALLSVSYLSFILFTTCNFPQIEILNSLGLLPIFVSLVLLFSNISYHLKTYEEKDKFKIIELTNTESSSKDNVYFFSNGTDRPLLYLENPIVEKWTLPNRISLALQTNTFYFFKFIS